jgi:hypothetical protein
MHREHPEGSAERLGSSATILPTAASADHRPSRRRQSLAPSNLATNERTFLRLEVHGYQNSSLFIAARSATMFLARQYLRNASAPPEHEPTPDSFQPAYGTEFHAITSPTAIRRVVRTGFAAARKSPTRVGISAK